MTDPAAPNPYATPAPARAFASNTLAILSLVSAFVIPLVAVITGHIALIQISKTGERGRGLAITGLIIGYIGFGLGIVCLVATAAYLSENGNF